MGRIPYASDLQPVPYTAAECEEITQEWRPYEFPGVMIETQLQADAPLVDRRNLAQRIFDGLICAARAFMFEVRGEWQAPY